MAGEEEEKNSRLNLLNPGEPWGGEPLPSAGLSGIKFGLKLSAQGTLQSAPPTGPQALLTMTNPRIPLGTPPWATEP